MPITLQNVLGAFVLHPYNSLIKENRTKNLFRILSVGVSLMFVIMVTTDSTHTEVPLTPNTTITQIS